MSQAVVVSAIAHQIQMAVAPVFLLAGIGAFLNVMAQRLARTVERDRRVPQASQGVPERRSIGITDREVIQPRRSGSGRRTWMMRRRSRRAIARQSRTSR